MTNAFVSPLDEKVPTRQCCSVHRGATEKIHGYGQGGEAEGREIIETSQIPRCYQEGVEQLTIFRIV